MAIQIKQSGVWKALNTTYIKHTNAWIKPSTVWVNDQGTWKIAWKGVLVLDITANVSGGYGINTKALAAGWDGQSPVEVNVMSGVRVTGNASNTWGMSAWGSVWPGGLTINNWGVVRGHGGKGGNGKTLTNQLAVSGGSNGASGGHGLTLPTTTAYAGYGGTPGGIVVNNYNYIQGGGGGGGGSGTVFSVYANRYCGGNSGGGGQSGNVNSTRGTRGTASPYSSGHRTYNGNYGTAGTWSARGNPGARRDLRDTAGQKLGVRMGRAGYGGYAGGAGGLAEANGVWTKSGYRSSTGNSSGGNNTNNEGDISARTGAGAGGYAIVNLSNNPHHTRPVAGNVSGAIS